MSTRYILDAEGRPVEAIMALDELRQVLEVQRQSAQALARVEVLYPALLPFMKQEQRTREAFSRSVICFLSHLVIDVSPVV